MEHIERAGVHSGDSIAVYPAWSIPQEIINDMVDDTRRMALALGVRGILNIQYVVYQGKATVIEANPRASRTVPYISKVTGVPIVELATRIMMGERLRDLGYGTGLYKKAGMIAVKVPVFSFEKLTGADTLLGPEMKSTGEVLGLAHTLIDAIFKGFAGAGYRMETDGAVLLTLRDRDKPELVPLARKLHRLGMPLYATAGTAKILKDNSIPAIVVAKIHENAEENTLTLIHSGKLRLVISTSEKGRKPARDSVKIRRKAVEMSIPCLTSVDTAQALADALLSGQTLEAVELVELHGILV
jgi:carbamoyl-phosphate synthase large subunit